MARDEKSTLGGTFVPRLLLSTKSHAVFAVAAIGLFAALDHVDAAEVGKIRLGGDYSQSYVGSARDCEQSCQQDPRCRSWTFIRPRQNEPDGQCRLKHLVAPAFDNRCCVSGVKDAVVNEEVAEERCGRFASRAVDQNEQNRAQRCGFRGQIWHGNYDRHYNRCLKLNREQRRREREERKLSLDDCVNLASRGRNMRCDHYVRISLEQQTTNTKNRCGFNNRNWHSYSQKHLNWCDQASRADIDQITLRREDRLRKCLRRGGGQIDQTCVQWADELVAFNERQIRLKCGYRKNRWHSDRERHYRACLAGRDNFNAVVVDIKRWVKRCERKRKKWKFILKF